MCSPKQGTLVCYKTWAGALRIVEEAFERVFLPGFKQLRSSFTPSCPHLGTIVSERRKGGARGLRIPPGLWDRELPGAGAARESVLDQGVCSGHERADAAGLQARPAPGEVLLGLAALKFWRILSGFSSASRASLGIFDFALISLALLGTRDAQRMKLCSLTPVKANDKSEDKMSYRVRACFQEVASALSHVFL